MLIERQASSLEDDFTGLPYGAVTLACRCNSGTRACGRRTMRSGNQVASSMQSVTLPITRRAGAPRPWVASAIRSLVLVTALMPSPSPVSTMENRVSAISMLIASDAMTYKSGFSDGLENTSRHPGYRAGELWRPHHPGHSQNRSRTAVLWGWTMNRGSVLPWSTRSVTLPIIQRWNPLRPWVVSAIRSLAFRVPIPFPDSAI